MNKVIFSSWAGDIVDGREDASRCAPAANFAFPMEYNGRPVKAAMSWNGMVVADEKVNVPDMAYAYLQEAYRLACGECVVGYNGLALMRDTLGRLLSGKGAEADIALLVRVGEGIKSASKCSFCATAVTPVVDSLDYYREDYSKLIGAKKAVSKGSYIFEVSAPCTQACPAHQDIPGYLELIRNRRYAEALELIRKNNCLPGSTGRACVAFCEAQCVRNDIDSPLAIRMLKRVPADAVKAKAKKSARNKEKVAVIGAGPAGLACSLMLARKGYKVTVFDEQPQGGGMAWVGIPSYRLPREALGGDVDFIKKSGVEFQFGKRFGVDITLDKLKKEGFQAFFLGTGAHLSRELGAAGEEQVKEGLMDGVEFLHKVNAGKKVKAGDRAVVIGGGNVAIDCARTCLRLGFKDVVILYRRSRAEMPGRREEIAEAEAEGARIRFLAAPVKVLSEKGKVTGLECIEMKLGEPDASGRRRPIAVPGSEFKLEADLVLPAVGEMTDVSFLPAGVDKANGNIKVKAGYQTSQPGVFAGGDCVSGPATLIEAIAAGNRAAAAIEQYLAAGKVAKNADDVSGELFGSLDLKARNLGLVSCRERLAPELAPVDERLKGFKEVEKVLDDACAMQEAARCLRCYRVIALAVDKGK